MFQTIKGQGCHLNLIGLPTDPKNMILAEDVEILLPVKFRFHLVVAEKSIRDQSGHLGFPIGPKKTNLVGDFEIVLTVKLPCSDGRRSRKCLGHLGFQSALKHKLGR